MEAAGTVSRRQESPPELSVLDFPPVVHARVRGKAGPIENMFNEPVRGAVLPSRMTLRVRARRHVDRPDRSDVAPFDPGKPCSEIVAGDRAGLRISGRTSRKLSHSPSSNGVASRTRAASTERMAIVTSSDARARGEERGGTRCDAWSLRLTRQASDAFTRSTHLPRGNPHRVARDLLSERRC